MSPCIPGDMLAFDGTVETVSAVAAAAAAVVVIVVVAVVTHATVDVVGVELC